MNAAPQIHLEKLEHGLHAGASRLNPRFSTSTPLLVATLDISWRPDDPVPNLRRLESALLAFLPRFRRHECRGAEDYHVFRKGEGRRDPGSVESELALAHLLEHAMIEFQCMITDELRCSGATAAYRDRQGRFDLMVECHDPRAGRCSLALAMAWLIAALDGMPPGPEECAVLAVAKLAYGRDGHSVTAIDVARAMSWPEEKAERALSALRDVAFLIELPWSMNLSGAAEYRMAEPRP